MSLKGGNLIDLGKGGQIYDIHCNDYPTCSQVKGK